MGTKLKRLSTKYGGIGTKKSTKAGTNESTTDLDSGKIALKKDKGSFHTPRKSVEKAILSGAEIDYARMAKEFGASRSTVSKVLKDLVEQQKLEKLGRGKYKLVG